jgi:multiple sugar transport system ATP-binding protein
MPKVLLLDEPLSNLDARLRLQTREELKRIQQETGITTIFVTHDQEEAMSISDLIVVMKDGVLQQMDLPQRVYDDPVNLFVAKFLGTPPINVFDGYFMNGKLCIGDTPVLDADCDYDGHVEVAVRPEGFVPCEDGPLECSLKRVEVMGRDISVVCDHPAFTGESFRAIVDGDDLPKLTGTTVRFALKPNKVFAFREYSGERIQF